MGREVAIKVAGERFSERFSREVHAVAALNHPNICHLYDVGPNYLVMELVEGENPRVRFRSKRRFTTPGRLRTRWRRRTRRGSCTAI